MLAWIVALTARAQDVTYWDFDALVPAWWAYPDGFFVASPFPNSGNALGVRVEPDLSPYFYTVYGFAMLEGPADARWIVTHDALALDVVFDPDQSRTVDHVGVALTTLYGETIFDVFVPFADLGPLDT